MTKHIKRLSYISLLLVLSLPLRSLAAHGDEEVKKKKTINKSYNVTAEDKLEIENSFGNVVVSTWDRPEITVDIEIGARASLEERVNDIMNELDVKELHSGHIISFKTKVGQINNGHNKNRGNDEDRAFYIDYVVHMPAGNRLELENSFGKTTVPDFGGEVTLTSKFGSLNTGKLANVDAIDVEFGRAMLTGVTNGKVVFKFNKESRIGQVNGNVTITSEFSHNVHFNVGENVRELSVFESYSDVRMVVTKTLSAEIDVHTSFGSFHNDSEFAIHEHREDANDYGPHFDKDFSGKAGDGKARIKIKSSFGDVYFSHTDAAGKDEHRSKHDKHDDDDDEKGHDEKTT